MPAFTEDEYGISAGKEYELSDEIYTKCLLLGVVIRASAMHEGEFILMYPSTKPWIWGWTTLKSPSSNKRDNIVYFKTPEEALEYWIKLPPK